MESLAGAFHPHAIEVQDFSHYALIIDVRSREEYADDHIPGAVQFTPAVVNQGPSVTGAGDDLSRSLVAQDRAAAGELPAPLAALVEALKLDQAILVYCGRGGLDSLPVARALRWRGWTADVLPGGWINYRRWVQAGMEVLPRMVSLRVIDTALGCEADRVLAALTASGHQVLNVGAMMVRQRGSITLRRASQPSQAWFESQLVQQLRTFDPRRPVWVGGVDAQVGGLRLAGSMGDALGAAPAAALEAPLDERVARWIEDEPAWSSPSTAIDALTSFDPPPDVRVVTRWKALARGNLTDLIASVLHDYVDRGHAARLAPRTNRKDGIPPLVVASLRPDRLVLAVRAWQAIPDTAAT